MNSTANIKDGYFSVSMLIAALLLIVQLAMLTAVIPAPVPEATHQTQLAAITITGTANHVAQPEHES